MRCRNRPRIAKAKLVELPHLIETTRSVKLVHRQKHRLVGLAKDAGDLFVIGVDARLAVNQKNDDVGFSRCLESLVANGALKNVVFAHFNTASVDKGEVNAVPIGLMVRAVAGDAAHLVHEGIVLLGDAVHEGGLAHVGASDDRNNR